MRRRYVAAGAATAAAMAVGAVLYAAGPMGSAAEPAPPPAVFAPESSCGLPGGSDAAAATWESVAGWPLPVSVDDGPGVRDPAGPWSCFTRTETGAVLAAYVIAMRVGGLADDWRAVATAQVLPGPGREALLRSTPSTPAVVTPRGFSVAAYDGTRATVRYYLTVPGVELSCSLDVTWSEGDWRLRVREDGGTSSDCQHGAPVTFTPWGPS